MSRTNSGLVSLTPEGSQAAAIGDLRSRMAAVERRTVTSSVAASITASDTPTVELDLSGSTLTGVIPTTATPQVTRVGLGEPADSTRTLIDTVTGEAMNAYFGIPSGARPEGARWAVAEGTASIPVTTENATLKVDRAQNIATADITSSTGLADAQYHAAITGVIRGGIDDVTMVTGLVGAAHQFSQSATRADACGVWGMGSLPASATTPGTAFGGFFEGRCHAAGQKATAIEIQWANWQASPTDSLYASTNIGAQKMNGITIQAVVGLDGSKLAGTGILFYRNATTAFASMDVGIGITSANNPIYGTSFRDDGSALRSIHILGAHATNAIEVHPTAGQVSVGAGSGGGLARLSVTASSISEASIEARPFSSGQLTPVVQVLDETGSPKGAWNKNGQMALGTPTFSGGLNFAAFTGSSAIRDHQGTLYSLYNSNTSTPQLPTTGRILISEGSDGTPMTTERATALISRTQSITSTVDGQANPHNHSALTLMSRARGADETMVTGLTSVAHQHSTFASRADACAVWGIGTMWGSSPGIGFGAYIEGRTTVSTGGAVGMEIKAGNYESSPTASDYGSTGIGANRMNAITIQSTVTGGAVTGGTGILFYRNTTNPNAQLSVGIGFTSTNSPIKHADIRSDSLAERGLYIVGAKSIASIEVADGAGQVVIGSTSGFQSGGIKFATDAYLYRSTTATLRADASFNVNNNIWCTSTGTLGMYATGGNGYFQMVEQSSDPSTPGSSDRANFWVKDIGGSDSALFFQDGGGYKGRMANVKAKGTPIWGLMPQALSSGSDKVTPGANHISHTAVTVGNPCELTGLSFAKGTVSAGNVILSIYDAEGTYIASTASTAVATDATGNSWQDIALIGAPIKLRAIGTYYVGAQFSDATCRFRAFNYTGLMPPATGTSNPGSFAAPSTITASTTYTANQGPVVRTY